MFALYDSFEESTRMTSTLNAAAYAACKLDMPSKGNLLWMSSHNTIAKL